MTDLTPLEPGTRVEWGKHDVLHVGTVIGQSEDPRDDGWYKVEEDQPDPSDNIRRWLLPLSAIHPPFEEAVATPPIPLAEVVRSCVVHDCAWTYPEPRQTLFFPFLIFPVRCRWTSKILTTPPTHRSPSATSDTS